MDNNENQNVQPVVQNPTPQEVLQNNGSAYTELGQESRHVDTSTLDAHPKKNSQVKIRLFVIFLVLFVE